MSASAKKPPASKSAARARKAPASASASAQKRQTIFLPTLLPDPFGEGSPELCWEWSLVPARLTLRLTQFGWSASALVDGSAICHFTSDSLQDLRENVIDSADLPAAFSDMALPWVLAYEVAGP